MIQSQFQGPREARWARAALALVVLGVALRCAQWFGNTSLWSDELALVLNITERGLVELLTRGLDFNQVAPVGYLLLTRVSVLLFGGGEFVLRLVPLGASILALVLFWRLAQRLLGSIGAFAATAGFALNPLLIHLGSVVKQYSTDVLATVVILLAAHALWEMRGSPRTRLLVGVSAGAVGFLSIPSILVAGAAMTALFFRAWRTGSLRNREAAVPALLPLIVWGTVAGAAGLVARALVEPDVHEYMISFWGNSGVFAPPFLEYPTWVLDHYRSTLIPGLFSRSYSDFQSGGLLESALIPHLGNGMLTAGASLVTFALVRIAGPGWGLATVLPFFFSLILARLEIYPLDPRTSAFLLPLAFLLLGALAAWTARAVPRSVRLLGGAGPLLVFLLFAAILVDRPPPYVVMQERELVQKFADRRRPEEPAFGFRVWMAMRYYGPRFDLGEEGIAFGTSDLRGDLSTLDTFRGEPSLWVLFTNADHRREFLLCYLDEIGRETERTVLASSIPGRVISLHRYDLSDEMRRESVYAADFPQIDDAFEGNPPRCRRQR